MYSGAYPGCLRSVMEKNDFCQGRIAMTIGLAWMNVRGKFPGAGFPLESGQGSGWLPLDCHLL